MWATPEREPSRARADQLSMRWPRLVVYACLLTEGCAPYVTQWEATLNARGGIPEERVRESEKNASRRAPPAIADDDALELLALENHVCAEVIDTLHADVAAQPAKTTVMTTTMLIKADGARMRMVKAPAENEPVLAPEIATVLALVSVRALGRPLDETVAHRPERVAAIRSWRKGAASGTCSAAKP